MGYNKDVPFHVPDFSKAIHFHSVGFLGDVILQPQQIIRCQHCERVGHEKNHCYDLHRCEHCGKKHHHLNKCFKHKTTARNKINFKWVASWDWSKTAKKIYRSYWQTLKWRVLHLLTLYLTRGELMVYYRFEYLSSEIELEIIKLYLYNLDFEFRNQIQSCRQSCFAPWTLYSMNMIACF